MEHTQKHERELLSLIEEVRRHLASLHYTDNTLCHYGIAWSELQNYAAEKGQSLFSLTVAEDFLYDRYGVNLTESKALPRHIQQRVRSVQILIDFWLHGIIFKRKKINDGNYYSHEKLFESFETHERRRGLAKGTMRQIKLHLCNFSKFLAHKGIVYFSEVEAETLHGFILTLASYAKHTVAYVMFVMKNLLRFAYENGYHNSDLSGLCPKIRYNSKSSIPSALTESEVTAVLTAVDRGNPVGKRDYAILTLAARLGLRVGEIRELRFDHIKWDTSRIEFIQPKTQKPVTVPLLQEVGWAIIDYIRYGRPTVSESKTIFIRHNAPYDKFGDNDNLHYLIAKYIRKAGISIPFGKRHGMHSLRHSLASNLLVHNTPIQFISEAITHARTETTNIYLKIDTEHLKECALEVTAL